jgi:hypothetical protein
MLSHEVWQQKGSSAHTQLWHWQLEHPGPPVAEQPAPPAEGLPHEQTSAPQFLSAMLAHPRSQISEQQVGSSPHTQSSHAGSTAQPALCFDAQQVHAEQELSQPPACWHAVAPPVPFAHAAHSVSHEEVQQNESYWQTQSVQVSDSQPIVEFAAQQSPVHPPQSSGHEEQLSALPQKPLPHTSQVGHASTQPDPAWHAVTPPVPLAHAAHVASHDVVQQ